MLQRSTPVPEVRHDTYSVAWALFILATLMSWPRLVILAFWIFGSTLGDAFGSSVIPIVGFFLFPWTIMSYAFMWSITSESVTGIEWAVVAVGVLFDVWTYGLIQTLRDR